VPKLIAVWNPTRGIWEDPEGAIDLLSEHSEPFLETWPTSGMTRNGEAFELLTPGLHTGDSGSSSLPTPLASDGERQSLAYGRGNPTLRGVTQALLPTPVVTDSAGTSNATAVRSNPDSKHHSGRTLTDVLMPTPRASRGASGTETMYKLGASRSDEGRTQGEVLLGTPRTSSANGAGRPEASDRGARGRLEGQIALLKTPTSQLAVNGGSQHPAKRRAGGHGPTLADEVEFLLSTGANTDQRLNAGSQ